jgi:hypothetical protein
MHTIPAMPSNNLDQLYFFGILFDVGRPDMTGHNFDLRN